MAKRNGLERVRGVNSIAESQLDPVAAARFALFEYMISNLDWAMTVAPRATTAATMRVLLAPMARPQG